MQKLMKTLCDCMIAIICLYIFWDDFPTLPAMYFLVTAFSLLLGLGCLSKESHALAWERRNVPEALQKKAACVQGVLFLLNAAVCPLGWLLAQFVEFDTDFILVTQIIGLPVTALLGVVPLLLTRKQLKLRNY